VRIEIFAVSCRNVESQSTKEDLFPKVNEEHGTYDTSGARPRRDNSEGDKGGGAGYLSAPKSISLFIDAIPWALCRP